jgi:hypothetical protein
MRRSNGAHHHRTAPVPEQNEHSMLLAACLFLGAAPLSHREIPILNPEHGDLIDGLLRELTGGLAWLDDLAASRHPPVHRKVFLCDPCRTQNAGCQRGASRSRPARNHRRFLDGSVRNPFSLQEAPLMLEDWRCQTTLNSFYLSSLRTNEPFESRALKAPPERVARVQYRERGFSAERAQHRRR